MRNVGCLLFTSHFNRWPPVWHGKIISILPEHLKSDRGIIHLLWWQELCDRIIPTFLEIFWSKNVFLMDYMDHISEHFGVGSSEWSLVKESHLEKMWDFRRNYGCHHQMHMDLRSNKWPARIKIYFHLVKGIEGEWLPANGWERKCLRQRISFKHSSIGNISSIGNNTR